MISQEEKLAQFTEFFTIKYNFDVNVEKQKNIVPDFNHLINNIPLPFRLASENSVLDQKALRPIQNLSNSAGQLVEYLQHQANKIDLLINYILSQHNEQDSKYQGIEFGGGGLAFSANSHFEVEDKVTIKLFILEENCAVYCYGEIIEKQLLIDEKNEEYYQYKAIFEFIREEDREVLVRTSLHLQSKHLQLLAQQRNQETKST